MIEESPRWLIENPIEFLFAEHYRQRQAASILHLIADGEMEEAGVKDLIDFIDSDFAIHVADEELSFFPMLKQHCPPEDNIDTVIERLAEEHKKDEATSASMTTLLNDLLSGRELGQEARSAIRDFAEHILKHLALENAVILPIARARLDDESQNTLSDMMKERRAWAIKRVDR